MAIDRAEVAAALPGYEIDGELGRGGWGIVLGGRHRHLERAVAIKQLPRAFAADPEVRRRFVDEARVLARLDHPHIVPIFDFVEHEQMCLLVMERLDGGTVWNRFTTKGFTPPEACAIAMATCAALEAAHRRGVLHRDVKPENLMFSTDGVVKLTDFGIAKVLTGGQTCATRAGDVLGTPAYMAPEQALGGGLSSATDVYAVGMLLYELLAGTLPFDPDLDGVRLLHAHAYEMPTPLLDKAPTTPASLAAVAMQALATDPADRIATAEALGVAIAAAATAEWGSGWLGRVSSPVLAAGEIVAVTERVTAPPSNTRSRTTEIDTTGASRPLGVVTSSTALVAVRPTTTARAVGLGASELSADDLVPVQTVVPEPPSPRPLWIAAVASLVLALVIALVGPGAPGRSGTIAARTVAINGSDPAARTVRLDLGQIVDVTGPASVNGHVVDAVTLDVQAAGISLVKRSAPPTVANGTFDASVDLSDGRYLVPGQSTGRLELHSGDTVVASRQFSIVSARSSLLTLPGIASVLLGMLALAWVESVLRNLRRGRRRRTGPWALGLVGGVVGLSIVLIVWGVGGAEPTALTAVVAVVLGISAGVAAALAAVRGARRRRGRIA